MTNTNYVLSFIDSEGVEQMINSSGDYVVLNGSILFNSFENAEKGKRKFLRYLKNYYLDLCRTWHDEAVLNPIRFENPGEGAHYIKTYNDMCLIDSNGIEIKEVILTIN